MVFSRKEPVESWSLVVRSARAGEDESQQKMLRHFSGYISYCASRFFLSEEDRQDLRQEGRIALFRSIRRYNAARGPFEPFARLVIRRHMNRAAEKIIHVRYSEHTHQPEDLQSLPLLMETMTPEREAMEGERRREMVSQVGRHLTELESRVLGLFLEGMSYRQMASRLRCPKKSVDNALRRIRAKVKV